MSNPLVTLRLYTDGSVLTNPGAGGWAFIIALSDGRAIKKSGGVMVATNNQMELTAVIEGLQTIHSMGFAGCRVEVVSDSQYVVRGATEWSKRWVRNGWRGSQGDPISNVPLWRSLLGWNAIFQTKWIWVRGHDGHTYNEAVDKMARIAAEGVKRT